MHAYSLVFSTNLGLLSNFSAAAGVPITTVVVKGEKSTRKVEPISLKVVSSFWKICAGDRPRKDKLLQIR